MPGLRGMTPESLRFGVIGTGHAARRAHLPAWGTLPGARLAALCDIDPEALESALRMPQSAGAAAFREAGELLASGVDAVSVCAHNAAHFPLALAALNAGKHVLCEKPLCVTAEEVRTLGAAADARGLVLMARHPLRFAAEARAAMAEIRAGAAGEIREARVRALRRDRIPTLPGLIDRELAGGGVALDLGVHALDIALWLMDFPRAVSVWGKVETRYGHDAEFAGHWGPWDRTRFTVEDFAAGAVRFENGATLSIECAWAGDFDAAEEGLSCTLIGDRGTVRWRAGGSPPPGSGDRGDNRNAAGPAEEDRPEFTAFLAAVRAGGPSPLPWREALPSIAILEGLYRSAAEGREVAVY